MEIVFFGVYWLRLNWQAKTGQGDIEGSMERLFLRVITLAQK
jgi:hypothetical protein